MDVGSSNADYLIEYKVFDDGSLLHRLPWCPIPTYSTITYLYSNFLKKIDNPIVVFDGYSGPSVKDTTHIRRSVSSGPKIAVSENNILRTSKDRFMSNESNNDNFLTLLIRHLRSEEIKCDQASRDAE